jgi:hypothetical protein
VGGRKRQEPSRHTSIDVIFRLRIDVLYGFFKSIRRSVCTRTMILYDLSLLLPFPLLHHYFSLRYSLFIGDLGHNTAIDLLRIEPRAWKLRGKCYSETQSRNLQSLLSASTHHPGCRRPDRCLVLVFFCENGLSAVRTTGTSNHPHSATNKAPPPAHCRLEERGSIPPTGRIFDYSYRLMDELVHHCLRELAFDGDLGESDLFT